MKARLPIGNLEDSEDWNASLRAVQKAVPPMHWQIFERYLMENLSSRQVAEEFQTTHFNVRVISHRIRKRVQEHLELLRGSDSNDGTGGRTGSTAPTSVPPLPATGTR
jgi:DNA-directed RNA polymerase specialized sigma24 family protein